MPKSEIKQMARSLINARNNTYLLKKAIEEVDANKSDFIISSGNKPAKVTKVADGKVPFIEYLIEHGKFKPDLYATSSAVDAKIEEWSSGIDQLVTYRFNA